jgi:FMN phosphatase YigB (HAD superfamily)
MTTVNRIFLDLDGVLADWASAAIRAHGHDPVAIYAGWQPGTYDLADVLGISGNAMWGPVNDAGADFWANLQPYPWCRPLMDLCTSLAPTTILTSPSKDPAAASGKTRWLQAQFGSDFRSYLIGPDKVSCARRGAVLIDDADKNCDGFRAAGGSAIVFPQKWNIGHRYATDPMFPVSFALSTMIGR